MPTTTEPKAKQRISVRRGKGSGVQIGIRIHFDPKLIGEERAEAIWAGIAKMLSGILTPDELRDFQRKLDVERQKLAKEGRL